MRSARGNSRGNQLLDRLLIPRLQNFAHSNDITDIDSCVEYLRTNYKEYQRHKLGPFQNQVARAVSIILKNTEEEDNDVDTNQQDTPSTMNKALASMYGSGTTTTNNNNTTTTPIDDNNDNDTNNNDTTTMNNNINNTNPTPPSNTIKPRSTPKSTQPHKRQRTSAPQRKPSTPFHALSSSSFSSAVTSPLPVSYSDLGGIESVLGDVRELIEYPLKHPEVYAWLGVDPPRGVLLHGPPGCGKTVLANAIANECNVPFLRVSAPEIVSGMSGESEAKIRGLFQEAMALAPCIVFIDEIDAIAPKREVAQREMERRIVAQLLTCLDDLSGLSAGSSMPRSSNGDAVATKKGKSGGDDDVMQSAHAVDDTTTTNNNNNNDYDNTTTLDNNNDDSIIVSSGKHVVVIGATNRPDAIDPGLRRAGRFDREISLGIPSEASREKILQVLACRLRLAGDFDFKYVAKRTPGFVGADLTALMKEAAALAVKRIFDQLESMEDVNGGGDGIITISNNDITNNNDDDDDIINTNTNNTTTTTTISKKRLGGKPLTRTELQNLAITMTDFEEAIGKVQPSVRREGFTTTPDVTWDDVGSLQDVREELSFAITKPIAQPQLFEAMGLKSATGVLLFGPPGCGKTLVAKAAANESGANFISIKGPELLNKYVGESERAVRQVFSRARAAAPCVLFFDEMDALAPRRGSDSANASAERLVNQLLTEMDGIDGRKGVYVIAATNRPDMIDPALLRPGRLDKILYVPLPPPEGRASVLQALTRKTPLSGDIDLDALAKSDRLNGFSGADLAALVREACVAALKEGLSRLQPLSDDGRENSIHSSSTNSVVGMESPVVERRHFEVALHMVQPSVSRKDERMYDALRLRLRKSRGHLKPEEAGDGGVGGNGGGGLPGSEFNDGKDDGEVPMEP